MKEKDNNINIINQWNNAAKMYSKSQRDSFNNLTNWEIIKELLGDIREKTILDAGTGDGYFANELKNMGAKVFACDGSIELIEIAKRDFRDIDFKLCDILNKLDYKDKMFDFVISSLVLMDIVCIDNFLMEVSRILKDDGKLIFSIVHPCYFGGDWTYDKDGNKQSKIIGDYWNNYEITLNFWGETTHFHRSITWYCKKLKQYGFLIDEIQENPNDLENFNTIKPHQKRIPLFMCFSCVKRDKTNK